MNEPYVLVAGSIGVGKSTLVNGLTAALPTAVAYFEEREFFLDQFYRDPEKYSFSLQLAYSLQYLKQAIAIQGEVRTVIQDRSIWDTHHVFSRWRRDIGFINDIEFRLLERTVNLCDLFRRPSLIVLLDADVAVSLERIARRGHPEESSITGDFLAQLREYYLMWFESLAGPKVMLNTESLTRSDLVQEVLRRLCC